MRLQAHEVRTRLPSHVLVAEYAYPYAFSTNLITNYGYSIGICPYTTRKLHFSLFLSFFLFTPSLRLRPSLLRYRRLQSTFAKAGLITHALVNALSRSLWLQIRMIYIWSRTWLSWSHLVPWLNLVSSYVCSVSGPDLYERNLQILDTNHSGVAC